ncbi:MAG: hypothetical protein Q7O66_16570 [Dehalococcoidia bacterium]|nr:hypothetical protein [Dehalococcoidia bacterium]
MLSKKELAEIAQLNEVRTPGEWATFGRQVIDDNQKIIVQTHEESNAAFIAACSVAVPAMLETIKTLKELLSDAWTEYAHHAPGCLGGFGRPCDCGYEQWLEQVKQAVGEEVP